MKTILLLVWLALPTHVEGIVIEPLEPNWQLETRNLFECQELAMSLASSQLALEATEFAWECVEEYTL